MKRTLAVLLVVLTSSMVLVSPAVAGSSTDAALALGAFAVFNQLVAGHTIFQAGPLAPPVVRETVVVPPPPTVIYAPPPPVVYAPPPPPPVVVYPWGYAYYPAPRYYAPAYPYGHFRGRWAHRGDDDDD